MFKGLWFFVEFGWKSNKKYIIYNIVYQVVHSLIPLVLVIMPKFIIDELLGARRPEQLILYTAILVGYNWIGNSISSYLQMAIFTLRIELATDFNLFLHERLRLADFENLENPRFLDLKEKANKFLYSDYHGFSYVLESAFMVIGQLFTLASITFIIGKLNIYMVILLVSLILMNAGVEAWAKKNAVKISLEQVTVERRSMYFSRLFEEFAYGKEVRLGVIGQWLLGQEKKYNEKVLSFYKRSNEFYIKSGYFSAFTSFLQEGVSYGYVIYRVLIGSLTIGDFMMYTGAINSFASAVAQIMSSIVEVKTLSVHYEAVEEYLNLPRKMRDNKQLPVAYKDHQIQFKNVSFKYPGQTTYVLKHINLVLQPGEKLSVVGENGAGKTTFVKLLTRLYDPTEGEILLDGVNIKDIDYDEYMKLFSTVFQDYKLFSFSLKENIALDKISSMTDEEATYFLKKVGLGDKLEKLSHGVNTTVYKMFDECGFEPSGGEGQKIALARALYKDAPIIVLDEPTAALDPRAEFEIYQKFNDLVHNKTAVYISHRLSSSRFCDKIIVFDKGEVIEYGSHQELIDQKGVYAELFDMQAQFYV